ncbi:MAG: Rieske 2Fe-2S domain-containing protein [Caulobacteraceae bacterium]|nr:Rieske 2Fe-2S domain-containing protein [Caulobacteraceae bacterium]
MSGASQVDAAFDWKRRANAPAPGTPLGPLEAIPDAGAKEYVFGQGLSAFRMFVIRRGVDVFAYLNLCPHYSLPLNHRPDEFLSRDRGRIMCRRHVALFRIEDGCCVEGACEGRYLDRIPVRVEAGGLVLG